MRFRLVQLDRFRRAEFRDLAVDARPDKSLSFYFVQHIAKLPGLPAHDRREEDGLRLRRVGHDLVDDLLGVCLENRLARERIVRLAYR